MLRPYHRGDSRPGATIIPNRVALASLIAAALATPAAGEPVAGVAPGGLLSGRALELSPGPPNGDLAAGLEGWTVEGRDVPALLSPGARVAGNVTLVSPPLALPAGAQTLRVAVRAGGGGGLVRVRARTDDGAPERVLADLEPGAARRSWPVPVSALAGRTVRIVIDPVPALGTTVDVLRVGPVTAPLPGWSVPRGTLEVAGASGRRAVTVTGAPLVIGSPRYRILAGPRRRTVSVDVRGDGVVRLSVAGRTVVARAGAGWRPVVATLPRTGRTRIAVSIVADPAAGTLLLRNLGLVVRRAARTPGSSGGSGSR